MVNFSERWNGWFFFQATIDFNGFDNVAPSPLNVFEGPTIGVNGFSMVFKILRAMVNDGFEVNDGFDVPLNQVPKINLRQNTNFEQKIHSPYNM